MNIINVTNPGQEPADGDYIELHHDTGAVERRHYHAPIVIPPTLAEAKSAKIAAIRIHFNGIVSAVKADAAPYEIDTWETQRAEYMAWQANNATPTPYVSSLAAARGIGVPELMAKIAPKVAGFAGIQGTQHKLEKLVEAAATIADVDAVIW